MTCLKTLEAMLHVAHVRADQRSQALQYWFVVSVTNWPSVTRAMMFAVGSEPPGGNCLDPPPAIEEVFLLLLSTIRPRSMKVTRSVMRSDPRCCAREETERLSSRRSGSPMTSWRATGSGPWSAVEDQQARAARQASSSAALTCSPSESERAFCSGRRLKRFTSAAA